MIAHKLKKLVVSKKGTNERKKYFIFIIGIKWINFIFIVTFKNSRWNRQNVFLIFIDNNNDK